MTPQSLLNACRSAGVSVRLAGSALKLRGTASAVAVAKKRLRPHKNEIIRFLLDQFEFDLDIQPTDKIEQTRINNMAWEFMQHDGTEFSEAIRQAATISATLNVVACEAAYEDVKRLWARMKCGNTIENTQQDDTNPTSTTLNKKND